MASTRSAHLSPSIAEFRPGNARLRHRRLNARTLHIVESADLRPLAGFWIELYASSGGKPLPPTSASGVVSGGPATSAGISSAHACTSGLVRARSCSSALVHISVRNTTSSSVGEALTRDNSQAGFSACRSAASRNLAASASRLPGRARSRVCWAKRTTARRGGALSRKRALADRSEWAAVLDLSRQPVHHLRGHALALEEAIRELVKR